MSARLAWLAAAVLSASASLWLASIALDPAQRPRPSEPGWISSGYLSFSLLLEGAGPKRWQEALREAELGSFGALNPPVGKYMFGAAVALVRSPDDPVRYLWQFEENRRVNVQRGNFPPRPLVNAARGVTVLCAFGTLLLLYTAVREATGAAWLSLGAPLLLFQTPVFREMSVLAFTDVPALFFLSATLAAAVRWARTGSRRWLLAAAGAAGLACAVKYSAASFVVALGLFALLKPASWQRRLQDGLLAGSVPLAVFVLVNPFLWASPVQRIRDALKGWQWVLAQQRATPALAPLATDSSLDGLAFVMRDAWWGSGFAAGLLGVLTLAGALRIVWKRGPGESAAAYGLLACIAVSVLLVVGTWLPFAWSRYALPAVLAAAPVQTLGLLWLGDPWRKRTTGEGPVR